MTQPTTNLLIPFRRDQKRDFANGSAEALLVSKARQVLLTEGATPSSPGELAWRTRFGSKLTTLRHKNNDETTRELARVWAKEALATWLPRVTLLSLDVYSVANRLHVRFRLKEGEVTATLEGPL